MAATLDDVRKELIANRKVTDDILKTNSGLVSEMTAYFKDLKEQAKQNLLNQKERERETKSATKTISSSKGGQGGSGLNIFGLPALGGLKGALAAITGGIIAIEAALLGFRGWEVKALSKIKDIGANLKGKGAVFGTAIFTKINDAFADSRARILKLFGLGVDGKPIVVQGKDGKFQVPTFRKITNAIKDAFTGVTTFIDNAKDAVKTGASKVPGVTKITESIKSLFSFVTGFVSGTTEFIKNAATGAAGKVFTTLKNLGLVISQSGAAGWLGVVSKFAAKLLWPLGLLVSGYDAVMEFINTEGNVLQKTVAGVYGFVASFIGAPLDLLKNLLIKAITLFGIKVDSEGKIIPGNSLPKSILTEIQKFSFQDYIKAVPQKIADIFNYILDFFKDPIGIGEDILKKTIDGIAGMIRYLIRGILAPYVPDSVLDKFRSDEEKLALVDAQISNQKTQLSNLNNSNANADAKLRLSMAKAAVDAGNFPTVAEALASFNKTGIRDSNYTEKAFIAQQSEINTKLSELMEERNDLMRAIAQNNAQPSIVNAPTNNISNVNQGFTTPMPPPFDPRMIPGTTFQYGLR